MLSKYLKSFSKRSIVIYAWCLLFSAWALVYISNLNFAALNFDACTLKKYLGLACIACGGTRATYRLIHFDIVNAFLYNPLYIILLAFGFIYAIIISLDILKNEERTVRLNTKFSKILIIILIVVCVLFCIVRNTPLYLKYFYF